MNKDLNQQKLNSRARVFKALAHPTRLRLLEALSEGEHCVCELLKKVEADQTTVSKHLALMKAAGVLDSEKRGNMVVYRVKMKCVPGFLSCVDRALLVSVQDQLEVFK